MTAKKRLFGMAGVDMKIIRNTVILRDVRTFELEWGVIRLWTKTRPVTGHATTFGEVNGKNYYR
jgi:hypothetical protein